MNAGDWKFRTGDLVEARLDRRHVPYEDGDAQTQPGRPGSCDGRAALRRGVAGFAFLFVFESVDFPWLPNAKEESQCSHGSHSRDDIHEPRPVKIGHDELRYREENSGDKNCGPD